ncbi:MAG: GNAT family N-acetyltransferase [Deltaproteobacteria bacterium]|nr:GNAT family N-acetyltransferase [Deltaproteobacteria bacterium]
MLPPRIETERLQLRAPVGGDAVAIYDRYGRDPEVTRYLSWRTHTHLDDARAYVATVMADWDDAIAPRRTWTITLRDDDTAVGQIGLLSQGHRMQMGYVLMRALWGHGYVPEAARALVGAALSLPQVHRVWAFCDVENLASARVMEKAGMQREGVLRRWAVHPNVSAVPRDVLAYAIVREV